MYLFNLIISLVLVLTHGDFVLSLYKTVAHSWANEPGPLCDRIEWNLQQSHDSHPLPRPLPDRFKGSLQCNPPPTGDFGHSHCGMAWYAIREFCNEFAYSLLRTRNNHREVAAVDMYNVPYINDPHRKLRGAKKLPKNDQYHLEIVQIPDCGDPQELWEKEKYTSDKWCEAMLYGTYSSCNNRGRGGSLTTGCLAYNFTTIERDKLPRLQ